MPHAPQALVRVLAITVLAIVALTGCGSTSAGSAGTPSSPSTAPTSSESAAPPMDSIPTLPVGSNSALSDSATTDPSTGPTSAPSSVRSGSTATAAASNAGGTDLTGDAICATLPAQTVKQLTGLDITQELPLAASPDSGDGCGYSSDDSSVQVQVQVFSSGSATDSWDAVSQGSNNTMITGLGEKALYDNDGTLYALKDARLLQVNGVDSQDQAVALATAVLPLL